MKNYAIIVAGGTGRRMGSSVRKQYLPVGGLPVLMHTLSRFYRFSKEKTLILVLPEYELEYWKYLRVTYGFTIPHTLVLGGATRFQSVRNGMDSIEREEGLVAIHDGVRPFVYPELISEGFTQAALHGNAIAVVPLKDSLRQINPDGNSSFRERDLFRLVQTPQTFLL